MQNWNVFNIFSTSSVGIKITSISSKERERVFFLLAQMFRAGQPAEASLRAVAKSFKIERKEEIADGLNAMAQKVAQGRPFSKACELEPVLFTDIHRAAILAGEASNEMYGSFKTLRELEYKKMMEQRSSKAELLTPGLMLVFSLVSIFNTGLNTLPQMVQVAKQQGKQMSPVVDIVLNFTGFFASYWHYIFGFVAACIITIISVKKTPKGKYWWDNILINIPIYGQFLRYSVYNSILLYFPRLIASGVKPKQMIPIMKALSNNAVLTERVDTFNQVLTNGGQISEALEKAGFPEIAVTPVRVSEHYTSNDSEVNDAMVEGMDHSHAIIERYLEEASGTFITSISVLLWMAGGAVMLFDMLSIVFSQNL